ncbi:hypothetical protein CKAN_02077700 [Cinnamomum micranthum f. kanehirae]|uniref:Uncharacterized protein n=1 Tax=Cinnamomum micranthum f. kanehirae TaxID=337451 RepID=A0A3S3QYA9_9MAGN|nr:hypothetical protein CKAN_02077700 [Cinnamomum micranthum f. kanehirae]
MLVFFFPPLSLYLKSILCSSSSSSPFLYLSPILFSTSDLVKFRFLLLQTSPFESPEHRHRIDLRSLLHSSNFVDQRYEIDSDSRNFARFRSFECSGLQKGFRG